MTVAFASLHIALVAKIDCDTVLMCLNYPMKFLLGVVVSDLMCRFA